jgi:uncharacterized protein (DUF1800 family)
MDINHLNSLRLTFSTKASPKIESLGLNGYIESQLKETVSLKEPDFIANSPKTLAEINALKKSTKKGSKEGKKNLSQELAQINFKWKAYILERCNGADSPVQEKINMFFQNHFVVTLKAVKLPYWIFKYYETINTHALGNYKTLVKEIVYSNAMIKYLDNQQNQKGKINENLGRELLELFTLGEGNYTESDIKNTALSLAGLSFGKEKGAYRPKLKDNSNKTVFGRSGNFKIDEVLDIIFEQPNTPYFLAEKLLKWFFYDNPSQVLVTKYGDILKQHNFELKPFFKILFTEECQNPTGGNQIKNPLTFLLQVHHELELSPNYKLMAFILKNQAMDVYEQPNVKGWKGGKDWLTSQIYTDRNQFIDFVIDRNPRFEKNLNKRLEKVDAGKISFVPKLKLKNTSSAYSILEELTQQMVFETNADMLSELNQLLTYDFDPKAENAIQRVLRVYQYIAKSPEFQII